MRNLPVTTYYLQVTLPGQIRPKRSPDSSVKIDRADNPAPEFAQWLYRTVGRDWYWVDRYNWTLDQWRKRFADPAVSLWVMDSSGDPAGYYELDEQRNGDMEFSSFGLLPGAIGRGLGGHMLTDGLERALSLGAIRPWLHTCSLDHPHALDNYLARGMELYKTEQGIQPIPDGWPMHDYPVLPQSNELLH